MEQLLQRLTETEGQKIEFEAGDQILTDQQLDELLDRSPVVMSASKSKKKETQKGSKSSNGNSVFTTVETVADDDDEDDDEEGGDSQSSAGGVVADIFDIQGKKSTAELEKERKGQDMDDEIAELEKSKSAASSVAGSNKKRRKT